MPKYIRSPSDLQTSHKATVDGFLEQAMTKTRNADPYVKKALIFMKRVKKCSSVKEILRLHGFENELIAAAGFSDKSKSKFSASELNESVKKVFEKIFERSKDNFCEEIVFRYLLTRGDSLGGSMRNWMGSLASKKLTSVIKIKLEKEGKKTVFTTSKSGKLQSIKWANRVLFFDVTPGFIKKNIDMILLHFEDRARDDKDLLNNPRNYLACGELKGGIDPAGADEHWKTANSALDRIRQSFKNETHKPKLFYVGAAIEVAMSKEIFGQLESKRLSYAANLNDEKQVADLVNWLVRL